MEMDERKFEQLDVDDILPNRFQPRIKFNETALNELAASIKEHGIIEPIVVRKLGDKFEIIAGERRYKASIIAGLTKVPAIVTDMNDKKSSEVALIENVQRQDLTPIEEAISYKKILDMGYLTQNDLAAKLGKNQSTVANKLRLLELSDEVQESLLDAEISERHARSLLRLKDQNKQNEVLKKIIEERLTVRKTDDLIKQILDGNDTSEEKVITPSNETEIKENVTMDNNQINETPITPNIVEEVAPVAPIINDNNNPGFMNVEAIEQNAEQIYQPKPLADLNDLLEPSGVEVPNSNTEVSQSQTQEETDDDFMLKPGKFFNIMSEEEKVEEPTQTEVNIFENTAPLPIINNQVAPESVTEEIETPDFNSLFGVTMNPEPLQEVTTEPVKDNVEIEEVDFNLPKTESNIPSTPIIETPVEQASQVETKPVDEIDYSKFYEPLDDEPTAETPKTDEAPIAYNNFALRNEPEIEVKAYETPTPTTKQVADIKTAINTIRSCADTIEKYGFEVDMDELDLQDTYQVIFNIKKH